MEEQEIYGVLENYRGVLEELEKRVEEMDTAYHQIQEQYDERFHNLEETLFDKLLAPVQQTLAEQEAQEELDAYRAKFGEKLDVFNKRLAPIEGDDFDLTKVALEGYKNLETPEGEEPMSEEAYVEALVIKVKEQLEAIKEAANAPEDAEVEAVVNSEGETEIKLDGEPVVEEVKPEEEKPAEEEEALEEGEDLSEEEMKRLEEEMRAEGLI